MFCQPKSLEEALEDKAELGERGVIVAGGTDLVVLMNHGRAAPEHLIDLSHCPGLGRVRRRRDGALELSGNATFAACARLPERALALAAQSVGGPGIRELGTVGGNLATASPAGDGSTALLALDAEIELRSVRGRRRLPVSSFFLGYRRTALVPDEIITRILVPAGYRSDWAKVGKRGAVNISIVAAAVAVTPERSCRIALASVAPTPIRCLRAEEFLRRNGVAPESIREAAEIARGEVAPITDHRASADYKTHLSGVLVRRLLENLCLS